MFTMNTSLINAELDRIFLYGPNAIENSFAYRSSSKEYEEYNNRRLAKYTIQDAMYKQINKYLAGAFIVLIVALVFSVLQ